MVLNNKVLTVSYGTFSCTLEGFDDSFGTMKAIAEYFRDLASDDRYFGAEPPQPDAEMLTRIAQREISRQVEASTSASGILLRATAPPPETVAQPEAAAVQVAETPVEIPKAAAAQADVAEVEVAQANVAEPVVEVVAEPVAEVVETKIAETETVAEAAGIETAETEAEVEVAQAEVTESEFVEAAPTEASETEAVEMVIEETIIAEVVETVEVETAPGDLTDDSAAVAAVMAASVDDVAEDVAVDIAEDITSDDTPAQTPAAPAPQPKPEFIPAADSIAAKLQRIRAVVSQNDQVVASDDYTEDEHAEPFVAGVAHDITQTLNADVEDQPVSPAIEAADDEISRVLDQLDASHDEMANDAQDQTVSDATALFDDLDDDDGIDDQISDDIDNILGADADHAPDAQKPPLRARVVKVKRSDLQAAIEAGDLEEVEDNQAHAVSSLTVEDEAELLRELASVEAELTPETDDFDATPAAVDTAEPEVATHGIQASVMAPTVSEDVADLSRLMDAADEKLDDPETSTSRETYSHMRAAVAAAQAERSAGGTVGQHTDDDAYREDLASVVRPRRPTTGGKRPLRPAADARSAPLKLVAEQRVDEGAGQVRRGGVRPRRVMTVPLEDADHVGTAEGEGGFADFATRMGATELPDMLEAAAAYLSFVEGRDQFSRPQLMNKIRQIKEDKFNREDGLRSFGQLLRDGKIQKTGGGRFTASGQIGFRPDTREVG